ncbi:uncharacterized protein CCOS01_05175 [Colletotrichum costaricense]|uniref:FAD-binding PCMH-type domain-containing protein n=1 Tax=Colletotrichum costaricense TaxID=1209916 RepID=A0AAI9YZM3_9PEZI|nr:uncharacterized protein CCOS01_05175 [Colletotrichum costaricense]KAK1530072.1 hypothetical protein CCOS01_05175 [Colletotrichum costaricense]
MSHETQSSTLAALQPLTQNLSQGSVITPDDPSYKLHSEPFAIQKQLYPSVVLIPSTIEELSSIVRFLYSSSLEFAIRGHGFKSPSAKDVIVSMLSFKSLEYDSTKKIATVGASATWEEVVGFMEQVDPDYSVPAARTPSIGVTGSILNGGLSWMSSEYGGISDPINFLDAEVVKFDGTVVMASQEPGLLWSLRGGGGGFGIITKVLLRAHPYPTEIWSGIVLLPRHLLAQMIDEVVKFNHSTPHPKVNYFMYLMPQQLLHTVLEKPEPDLGDTVIFHLYDALGEEHGRATFGWILEKPGAIDQTRVTNMKGVLDMQRNANVMRGTMKTLYAPMAVSDLDRVTIARAIEVYDNIAKLDQTIHDMSSVIFEFLLLRPPIGGTAEVAWPRSNNLNHLLLFIISCPGNGTEEQEKIIRQISNDAPGQVLGLGTRAEVNPAGLEPSYHDVKGVYREHYEKLVELRRLYDPKKRFQSFFQVASSGNFKQSCCL